ncbi:MAG TPA: hypothetical protein PLQ36_02640 [Candidatus Gracilibacteria bacterium]|nr:hypothetical protein [Candidatus Gracilibacteria bacterium]
MIDLPAFFSTKAFDADQQKKIQALADSEQWEELEQFLDQCLAKIEQELKEIEKKSDQADQEYQQFLTEKAQKLQDLQTRHRQELRTIYKEGEKAMDDLEEESQQEDESADINAIRQNL